MAAQLGFTRIFFDCNLCCDAEELDICEFIAANCPGGGELDTNFLEDDLTQDAPRTHNFAGFSHTWNSVGALTWDNDGDIVFVNAFVQDDTQTHVLVRNSTTGRVEYRDASTLGGVDTNFLEDDLTQDANRTHNFAGFNHIWNSVGDWTIDNDGDIILVNPLVQDDTQTDLLVRDSVSGRIEFRDVSSIGGGADTNFLEDDLTQDANRTHNFAGFNHIWNSVNDWTIDNDGDIVFSNAFVNDDTQTHILVRNNVSGRVEYRLASTLTGTVDLCDADGDTCFVNEETADEDVIRFTIGITDVRTFAGFINDTSVAYGREAGLLIPTDKTLEQTLIGKCAGKDLTATSTSNTMLGSDTGLLHTVLTRSIFIGEHAGALALGADEGTGHFLNIAIGEFAGADQSENANSCIWIGTNAGRGAGDFAVSGEGPQGCIGIGDDVLRNIHGTPNKAIGMGLNALNMMEIGTSTIMLGDEAAETYVGTLTPGEELDECAGIGFQVAKGTTVRLWQSTFAGHAAGRNVDSHVNNVIIGWNANNPPTATKIPSHEAATIIGSDSGIGMGGSQNTCLGDGSGSRGTLLGSNNTTITRTLFLGTGTWYETDGIDRAVAIGPGVKVDNDDTLILGFIQDQGGILPDEQLKIGIGTDNPLTDIQINATTNNGLRYQTGAEGLNKVLGSTDGLGTIDYFSAEVLTEATVTTTDATPTTCGSIATTTDRSYIVETRVVGRRTSDSAALYTYKRIASAKNDAGVLTVGSPTDVHTDDGATAADATITNSGTNIIVEVTGLAATNIDWKTRTSIVEV